MSLMVFSDNDFYQLVRVIGRDRGTVNGLLLEIGLGRGRGLLVGIETRGEWLIIRDRTRSVVIDEVTLRFVVSIRSRGYIKDDPNMGSRERR